MPAKKSSKKKTSSKKPSTAKASAKRTAKSTTTKRNYATASASNNRPFMEARFSEQTVYWIIIGVAVIALAVWVLSLQAQINAMYDQIQVEASNTYVPLNSRL